MSVTLTGGPFTDAHATAVASGTLRLQLSKDARRSGGQVCRAYQVDIPLDANGSIASSTTVYGNDELTPTDTYYVATVFDSNRSPVYGPVQWLLTGGGTVNVNTINPTTGVSTAGVSIDASLDTLSLDRANQDVKFSRASAGVVTLDTGNKFQLKGATSGGTIIQATAVASGTITVPAATDTLVGKTTTDTLTNKTLTSPVITGATIDSNVMAGTAARLAFKQACVRVFNSTTVSISSATTTAVTWDSETYDTDGLHSTSSNTSRLTASVTGKWLVTASVDWAVNATGNRQTAIRKNGATNYIHMLIAAPAVDPARVAVSDIVDLAAGDYVECMVYQSSGGALTVNGGSNISSFSMILVGQ